MRPHVTLGGLPIDLHAGAPQQQYSAESGSTDVRLSGGALVRMHHWRKETITVSGTGWMGAGLDGLDYTQPLELRCTQPKSVTGPATTLTIIGTPRPDVPVWAHALVGRQWVRTPVALSGSVATCTAVAGASTYRVSWMPVYFVLCQPPAEALDASAASFSWQFSAREI